MKTVGIKEGEKALKLSTKGKYGLTAMMFLAEHAGEGPQSLRAIGESGLPDAYLEQLLGVLRKGGLVTAVRGAQGGYQLSRPPKDITLRQILDTAEGPLRFSDCAAEPDYQCPRGSQCPTRDVWAYLTERVNGLMDEITLLDMIEHHIHGE